MIPCTHHRRSIVQKANRALDETEAKFLDYHLERCRECRNYARQLRGLVKRLEQAGQEMSPVETPQGLAERIEEQVRQTAPRARSKSDAHFPWGDWFSWPRLAVGAITIMAGLLALKWMISPLPTNSDLPSSSQIAPLASAPRSTAATTSLTTPNLAVYHRALRGSLALLEEVLDTEAKSPAHPPTVTTILDQRRLTVN